MQCYCPLRLTYNDHEMICCVKDDPQQTGSCQYCGGWDHSVLDCRHALFLIQNNVDIQNNAILPTTTTTTTTTTQEGGASGSGLSEEERKRTLDALAAWPKLRASRPTKSGVFVTTTRKHPEKDRENGAQPKKKPKMKLRIRGEPDPNLSDTDSDNPWRSQTNTTKNAVAPQEEPRDALQEVQHEVPQEEKQEGPQEARDEKEQEDPWRLDLIRLKEKMPEKPETTSRPEEDMEQTPEKLLHPWYLWDPIWEALNAGGCKHPEAKAAFKVNFRVLINAAGHGERYEGI